MSKWRNSASSQRTAANSAPMPLNSSNILPAGAGAAGQQRGEQRVALGLGLLDLIKQQFEPIEFAPDLGLEPTGNTNFGLNRRVSPRPYR